MMKAFLRLLVSSVLVIWLFWWIGAEVVWSQFRNISLIWLGVAVLALTLSTYSMARRWQITAHALGLELTYSAAVKEYYAALFCNAVLPGGIMGDISRAVRLRHAGDMSRAAQSVLAERLIGQVAMVAILGMGLTAALIVPGGIVWPTRTVSFLALGSILSVAGIAFLSVLESMRGFMGLCIALVSRSNVSLHALGAACALLLGLYACARATGTAVTFEAVVTVLPLIFCAMVVPLSVAGWGWREGTAAAVFPLFGATPQAGVAAGLCFGAVMLAAALPGALFVVRQTSKSGLDSV